MGAVTGLLGIGGGPDINNPTTPEQFQQAYAQVQQAQQQQQQLLAALQGQGGIQNQSNVYGQFQDVAAGNGPNPAMAMLNNTTGTNVANQAALMAGQRGAGANVGLMARQAANQGANIQQQAAGQGAALQANQSLNALGAAGNIANNQVANQMGQTNSVASGAQNLQNSLFNANAGVNSANVAAQGDKNKMYGGLASGIGAALAMADGGQVPSSAVGHYMRGMMMQSGGRVPGAQMGQTNTTKNDVVPAMLTPGENVIDIETMNDKGKVGKAARFVAAAIAKRNAKK